MTNLTILNTSIRTLDNLYSLNDLHRISGSEKNYQPNFFIRNQQTKELVAEIERSANSMIALKTVRGGRDPALQGTWACKELVIAYAAWISPAFHLVVLRAFLNQIEPPKQLALPNPERKFPFELSEYELQCIAWDWFALFKCVEFTRYILPALESIQSKFAAQASSIVSEYGSMLRRHQPIIQKLTAEFKTGMWENENWNRVLPTIRDNDLLRPKRQLGKF